MTVSKPVRRRITKESRRTTKKKSRSFGEGRYWGLLLIAPWLIGLLLFQLIPILTSFYYSLTDFYLLEPAATEFVGLRNYIGLFSDPNLLPVLWRTALVALLMIPMQTGLSLFFAGILSSEKLLMKNTMRALFFLPSIIPAVAATFMWQGFVDPGEGWLNRVILSPFNLEQLNIFAGRGNGQALFILGSLWMIGPGMLIIMGAMQGIPREIMEAAWVDGAGSIRRFFSITLPLVTPAIFFTLVLNLTAVSSGAMLMDRGFGFSTGYSSFDDYIYNTLFRSFRVGQAASLAWFFFLVIMILVIILFYSSRHWVYFPDNERKS